MLTREQERITRGNKLMAEMEAGIQNDDGARFMTAYKASAKCLREEVREAFMHRFRNGLKHSGFEAEPQAPVKLVFTNGGAE